MQSINAEEVHSVLIQWVLPSGGSGRVPLRRPIPAIGAVAQWGKKAQGSRLEIIHRAFRLLFQGYTATLRVPFSA